MPRRGDEARSLATVLFTDIVGSTELASELGDERWKQVLETHHGVVRKTLKRYGGREVDTAGDGFFATFDKPAEAIRCAADIIDQLRAIGIRIRAGVHIGEVEQMGPKVGGIAVHIGARVASKAGDSEILVSSTVRDLVAGSDIRFADRGVFDLKGVPGEFHLYSIDHELSADAPAKPQIEAPAAKAARRRTLPLSWVAAGAVVLVVAIVLVVLLAGGGASNVVAVPGADTVSRIDAKTARFAGTTTIGSGPGALTAGGGAIWALNVSDQTLARIDASVKLASARAVGGPPSGIAYGAGSVWVTAQFGLTSGAPGSLLRFDPGTPGLSKPPIPVGNGAGAVAFGEGGVWITNAVNDTVLRVDPAVDAVVQTIRVGNGPQDVTIGAGAVWVANTLDNSVWKIDPKNGSVLAKINIASPPTSLAVAAGTLWVASDSANTVTRVDASTGTVVATIAGAGQPVDIVAGTAGVWVAADSEHAVLKIDPSTNKVVKRLPVHGSPAGLVIVGDEVWVTVHA